MAISITALARKQQGTQCTLSGHEFTGRRIEKPSLMLQTGFFLRVRSDAGYYSAFGLALRAAVAHSSGVQRGQMSALVGAIAPRGEGRQGVMCWCCEIRALITQGCGNGSKCVFARDPEGEGRTPERPGQTKKYQGF